MSTKILPYNIDGSSATSGQVLSANSTGGVEFTTVSGSKWTDSGSDIYRNSKVAIGSTTAPTAQLEVTGTAAITANLVVDTTSLVVDAVNNRVGLGTASPAAALDISGTTSQNAQTTTGTMDLSTGQVFSASITAATTFAFNNTPASRSVTVVLRLTNGGSQTLTWPGYVKWPGGTAPTLTSSGTDLLVFHTDDGGTTWRGNIFGKDIK